MKGDFVRLPVNGELVNLDCERNGIPWPPPEKLNLLGLTYDRVRFSQLTDEQMKDLTMILRGAEYVLSVEQEAPISDQVQ